MNEKIIVINKLNGNNCELNLKFNLSLNKFVNKQVINFFSFYIYFFFLIK